MGRDCFMKILIVSDTHGKHENLRKVLQQEKPIDLLIHLGDVEGGEEDIRELAGCPAEIVAGNNDFFTELPLEKELMLGKYRTLITHGHYYYVGMGIENIRKEAESRNFDIVMFGHIHRPVLEYGERVVTLNPGSISYPRQEGRDPSYILMNLDEMGDAHFEIKYL